MVVIERANLGIRVAHKWALSVILFSLFLFTTIEDLKDSKLDRYETNLACPVLK
jgi:hypothetical protein